MDTIDRNNNRLVSRLISNIETCISQNHRFDAVTCCHRLFEACFCLSCLGCTRSKLDRVLLFSQLDTSDPRDIFLRQGVSSLRWVSCGRKTGRHHKATETQTRLRLLLASSCRLSSRRDMFLISSKTFRRRTINPLCTSAVPSEEKMSSEDQNRFGTG